MQVKFISFIFVATNRNNMAKAFKPIVFYHNHEGKYVSVIVNTYTEVKKRMNEFMDDSDDNFIRVYRHRRGEWGEWFEHWAKIGSKCEIIKQGWQ